MVVIFFKGCRVVYMSGMEIFREAVHFFNGLVVFGMVANKYFRAPFRFFPGNK